MVLAGFLPEGNTNRDKTSSKFDTYGTGRLSLFLSTHILYLPEQIISFIYIYFSLPFCFFI